MDESRVEEKVKFKEQVEVIVGRAGDNASEKATKSMDCRP